MNGARQDLTPCLEDRGAVLGVVDLGNVGLSLRSRPLTSAGSAT